MEQKEPAIAIIGAGPAGLLTAHYLQARGYRNVVVLEKLGRVGGLCETITAGGHSFDLGANYVTPAYREILRLAEKLDEPMYSERPFVAMTPPDDPNGNVKYQSIFKASRQRDDGSTIPILRFGLALFRYTWIRWQLRRIIDKPTFEGVAEYDNGSLCQTLEAWLIKHGLIDLKRVFQLPITLMGFGSLDETAAIYALKFMTVRSFVPMVLKEAPFIGRLVPWPRRFLYGYQRFFERLAWDLDVRTNVDIKNIDRSDSGASITYNILRQDMSETDRGDSTTIKVDHVILACPLNNELVKNRIGLDDIERRQLDPITPISYCMTTRSITLNHSGLGSASPLAAVYPVPKLGSNVPYGVAKQWPDCNFAQFYTRTLEINPIVPVEGEVQKAVDLLIKQMGGVPDSRHVADETFNRFEYFQHVSPEQIKGKWYDTLETLQGRRSTYYVGGATNFELIEPIAEYAKNLVEQNFPKQTVPPITWWSCIKNWFAHLGPRARRCLHIIAALLVILVLVYIFCMPLKSVPIEKPVATSSPEAIAASERFWDVIHADDATQIASLLEELMVAYAINPNDATLTAILGGTHLWRFHLRARIGSTREEQIEDLEFAVRFGKESIAIDDGPSSTAPSLTAAAEWELASLLGQSERVPRIQMQSIENSLVYPQFAGFVQGWMFAAMLDTQGPDYDQALEGYHFMMSQCAGFSVADDLRFNKLIHTFYGIKSIFEPVCYNNPLAPHSIEGTFIGYGDAFLKQGNLEKARLWYENAKTSPTYSTWSYQSQLEYRLNNLEALSVKFAADWGKVDVQEPAMNFQSDIGCGVCHTR